MVATIAKVLAKLATTKTGRKIIAGILLFLLGVMLILTVSIGALFASLIALSANKDLYYPLINSTRITEPFDPDRIIIHEYDVEVQIPKAILDEDGKPVLDEDGNPAIEIVTEIVHKVEEIESPHWGVDFEVWEGSYVVACAGGVVRAVYTNDEEGNVVEIEHIDGTYTTRYLHLDAVLVRQGQDVILGQPLGRVGLSGECTPYRESGANVHLEVVNAGGEKIDPAGVLHRWGQYLDIPTELVKEVAGSEWADWMVSDLDSDIIWTGEGYMWPVPGHTHISSSFGHRVLEGEEDDHSGIDIPAPAGTPIYAAAPGVVSTKGHWSYGICVKISVDGQTTNVYGHMSARAPGITDGVQVEAGQLIGYVGSTGNSTGNHLHFQVNINGTAVDPMPFFS